MAVMSDDELRKAARKNLKARNDFKVMLAIFAVLTVVLVAIWFFTGAPRYFWPAWPILGFTIASVFSGLDAYGITRRQITEADVDAEVARISKRSGPSV
ncbi:hypothetical protein BH11ACT3_BH11ACT3_08950 [soil metagenome]